jgi:uncharacterized protein (UPF0332 family)
MMDTAGLVKANHIQRIEPSRDLADKEFAEADYDLERAHLELANKGNKWAIVKAYYSVFHSAKGILFLIGYREKTHFGVGEMLALLSKDGKLEGRYVNDFKAAMSARQGADYHYEHSLEAAKEMIALADGFLERMKRMRKELKA